MTTQHKHLLLLIMIVSLMLIVLTASRLVASPIEGLVVRETKDISSRWGTAYVWGPKGEELVTIDRVTNAIISRALVGSYADFSQ